MAVFQLRKVDRRPTNAFFARWRLPRGGDQIVAITEADYRQVSTRGGSPPNTTGEPRAIWL